MGTPQLIMAICTSQSCTLYTQPQYQQEESTTVAFQENYYSRWERCVELSCSLCRSEMIKLHLVKSWLKVWRSAVSMEWKGRRGKRMTDWQLNATYTNKWIPEHWRSCKIWLQPEIYTFHSSHWHTHVCSTQAVSRQSLTAIQAMAEQKAERDSNIRQSRQLNMKTTQCHSNFLNTTQACHIWRTAAVRIGLTKWQGKVYWQFHLFLYGKWSKLANFFTIN